MVRYQIQTSRQANRTQGIGSIAFEASLDSTKAARPPVKRVGKTSELRIDVGPDYRLYFTTVNGKVIFVLAGGDKRTQQADIDTATRLAENLEL